MKRTWNDGSIWDKTTRHWFQEFRCGILIVTIEMPFQLSKNVTGSGYSTRFIFTSQLVPTTCCQWWPFINSRTSDMKLCPFHYILLVSDWRASVFSSILSPFYAKGDVETPLKDSLASKPLELYRININNIVNRRKNTYFFKDHILTNLNSLSEE